MWGHDQHKFDFSRRALVVKQRLEGASEVVRFVSRPLAQEECEMAKKGYWVGHINVTSPERYKDYIAANAVPLKKYGARFLVRNGACEVHGDALQGRRHVVIEFESYAIAKACYDSPEYQAAAKIRDEASTSDFVMIEGHED
jgi:uncharacterized protein (DUF1330 family)